MESPTLLSNDNITPVQANNASKCNNAQGYCIAVIIDQVFNLIILIFMYL